MNEADDHHADGQLQEVNVRDAPPQVQSLFREITDFSGVNMPALIFRRLAVRPDALAWVWESARPLLADGCLQECARLLMAHAQTPPALGLPPCTPADFDGDLRDKASAQAILMTYNRINPINLLIVKNGLLLLAGTASSAVSRSSAELPLPLPGIPDPVPLEKMDPETRRIVLQLGAHIPASKDGVLVPTLYRHLSRWPALLARLAIPILARLQDGSLDHFARQFSESADLAARQLLPTIRPSAPDPDLKRFVDCACMPFLTSIPQLAMVGKMLEQGLFPDSVAP
jgi:hypothetical protein